MTFDNTPLRKPPHLTPETLVGRRFGKDTFNPIQVALVGYCPPPAQLEEYQPRPVDGQRFIHLPPASVQVCISSDVEFLSLTHVYGGPVSAATVEELAYYGIKYILGYGLAGGLGTRRIKMGDCYIVEKALALDGTTPHYTNDKIILSDATLNAKIQALARQTGRSEFIPVQAMTGDAIYREYDEDLAEAKTQGCDIVNCDSSHLFAASRAVGIQSTECGVISDVAGREDAWESQLSVMLSAGAESASDPLARVGEIVTFYAEVLVPALSL